MTDLFDDARPVRDATIAEFERCTDAGVPEVLSEGYRVGIHLAAIMMTAVAKRLGRLEGPVEINAIHPFVAVAIAQVLAYGACSFRPMLPDGRPVSGAINLVHLTNLVLAYAMRQVELQEQGLQDFFVPFEIKEDGSIVVKEFDFQELLGRGGV